MGIKGLPEFLKKKFPEIYKKCYIQRLANAKIAIDTSILMYKFMSVSKRRYLKSKIINGLDESDNREIRKIWLSMFLDNVNMFLSNKIKPIYVFDGKPIEEKMGTIKKRMDVREKRCKKIEELSTEVDLDKIMEMSSENISKYMNRNEEMVKLMINDIEIKHEDKEILKSMLTKIGIPIIQSNCDAEKTCSLLTNEKKVNAAYSSDTDLFIIGCRIVITDIEHVVENKERKIVVTFVEHKDILNSLEITSEQLKEFGILCGTDYNLNIHGIGPVKALSLIKNYGTIENSISNICPSEDEICNLNVDICKKIFTECKCEETVEGEINLNINKEIIKTEGIQFLNDFGLYEYYQKIINNFDI